MGSREKIQTHKGKGIIPSSMPKTKTMIQELLVAVKGNKQTSLSSSEPFMLVLSSELRDEEHSGWLLCPCHSQPPTRGDN